MSEYEDNLMEMDVLECFNHFCHGDSPNSPLLSLQDEFSDQPLVMNESPDSKPEIKSL